MAHSSAYLLRSSDTDASIVANQIQLQTLSCCFLECHVAAEHGRSVKLSKLWSSEQEETVKQSEREQLYKNIIYIYSVLSCYIFIYIYTLSIYTIYI